jgi:hypothetical protein
MAIVLEQALIISRNDYIKSDVIHSIFEEPLFLNERLELIDKILSEIKNQKQKDPIKVCNLIKILKTFYKIDS